MDEEFETFKLWRARKTAFQLCRQRGYYVHESFLNQTLRNFKEEIGDQPRRALSFAVPHFKREKGLLGVIFSEEPANLRTFTMCYHMVEEDNAWRSSEKITRVVVVIQRGPTPPKRKIGDIVFETFQDHELFNINENELVPDHVILTPEEKTELLLQYDENQLPRLQADDFAARYFGVERGQVVRIVRPSELRDRPDISYRLVV